MITLDAFNSAIAQLATLVKDADNANELYGVIQQVADITAQRAHALMAETAQDTREFEWLVQVKRDSLDTAGNAERMSLWIDNETV